MVLNRGVDLSSPRATMGATDTYYRRKRVRLLVRFIAISTAIVMFLKFAPPQPRKEINNRLYPTLQTHCNKTSLPPLQPGEVTKEETLLALQAHFECYLEDHSTHLRQQWINRLAKLPEKGIVISAGYQQSLVNAFISLIVVRQKLKSRLPVVVAYWGAQKDDRPSQKSINFMKKHIKNLEFLDLSTLNYPSYQKPLVDEHGEGFVGWKIKAFAVYAAPFQQVMYLDSDSMPVINPDTFFNDEAYTRNGNLFWPDVWCKACDLHTALGMPITRNNKTAFPPPQTETGQFLIDKRQHYDVLEWYLWLNSHDKIVYELAYGDKDTPKAAFYLAKKLEEFTQVSQYLGILVDKAVDSDGVETTDFSLRAFGQFAPDGALAFVHRISKEKYELDEEQGRNIRYAAIPSCAYFKERGWDAEILKKEYVVDSIIDKSTADCKYSMHDLHAAAKTCAGYDTLKAKGRDKIPIFEIPGDSYVARMTKHHEQAFKFLLAQKKKDQELFELTENNNENNERDSQKTDTSHRVLL